MARTGPTPPPAICQQATSVVEAAMQGSFVFVRYMPFAGMVEPVTLRLTNVAAPVPEILEFGPLTRLPLIVAPLKSKALVIEPQLAQPIAVALAFNGKTPCPNAGAPNRIPQPFHPIAPF